MKDLLIPLLIAAGVIGVCLATGALFVWMGEVTL